MFELISVKEVATNTPLRMSTVQIAEFCGKRHDNVVRDLRVLVDEGLVLLLKFEQKLESTGGRPMTIYNLPRRETLLLVSGYRADVRAKIIDEFERMEQALKSPAPQLPDFTNPAIAARAWADEVEAKEDALKLASKTNYKNEKLLESIEELEGEHEDVTLGPAKAGRRKQAVSRGFPRMLVAA